MKPITPKALLKDLRDLITQARQDVARQVNSALVLLYWRMGKRIQIDNDDHYLDLLFYHRGLRRLMAIDLKLRDFQPADKGQIEFYLRWLSKYEQRPEEESPIGLILCAGKKRETIELMELEEGAIRVSSCWTKVLPKKLLQKKLHEAIKHARDRLAQREEFNGKKLLPK